MIDLSNKHIFVVGGSRGIGRATASMAARAGAHVAVNFLRDEASADQVVREIRSLGRKASAIQADMSQESQADRAVDQPVQTLGPIWGLVLTAGIFEPEP